MRNTDSTRYNLKNKKVAILATHGFEASELFEPLNALRESGADTSVVSLPESDSEIRGWKDGSWAETVEVNETLPSAKASDYDALVLPGGLMNPDRLRQFDEAVNFVKAFFEAGKPVAAICHAPWLIVEADAAKGRTMTSYPSIRTDLMNAGAIWKDQEVVTDQGLVTSRSPSDLEAFIPKMLEEIAEGVHEKQHA